MPSAQRSSQEGSDPEMVGPVEAEDLVAGARAPSPRGRCAELRPVEAERRVAGARAPSPRVLVAGERGRSLAAVAAAGGIGPGGSCLVGSGAAVCSSSGTTSSSSEKASDGMPSESEALTGASWTSSSTYPASR